VLHSFIWMPYTSLFFSVLQRSKEEVFSSNLSFISAAVLRGISAQAVSRQPLTTEARVRGRVTPCGVCGRQRGTAAGYSSRCSVFPCQYHSAVALGTHVSS